MLASCRGQPEGSIAPDAHSLAPSTPPPPPPLSLTVEYRIPDAGWETLRPEPGTKPFVPATDELKVLTNLPVQNYRIRLFDEGERVLPSEDNINEPKAPLDYHIQLPTPLKAGHRYALVVDAQNGPTFSDALGRVQPEQRIEFQVSGEREKPAPVTKRRKRRRF